MMFRSALIAVESIHVSRKFYEELLGQTVENDFGENVAYSGGFCLQEKKLWSAFLQKPESAIRLGGNDAELYFEIDGEIDDFVLRLAEWGAELVAPPAVYAWGQKAVRFYDPDRHIVEAGESIAFVCRRFLLSGLSVEETARVSQMPEEFVQGVQEEMKEQPPG
ncbi:MAG: glyoxalase [Methanocorpusculum sp.]|nr:glyoxalase [Methanocorpusculum sp.]